jgi:hypothetical protein
MCTSRESNSGLVRVVQRRRDAVARTYATTIPPVALQCSGGYISGSLADTRWLHLIRDAVSILPTQTAAVVSREHGSCGVEPRVGVGIRQGVGTALNVI